jgi:hypothetical protein
VARPPARTFELLPDHFADDFEGRPVAPIEIGLRLSSEDECRTIEDAAERLAMKAENGAEALEIYNRNAQCFQVARAICDPNDVTSGHPFFDMPEDLVPVALKPAAILRIRQELHLLQIEQSPLHPEADDEEVGELSDLLALEEPFAAISPAAQGLARRYLKFALELIRNE